MFQKDLLKGKRFLITGGGTGLGRSYALRMAELGADLVLCGRRGEVVVNTAQEITELHDVHATGIACDIRDSGAVEEMFEQVWQEGPLNGLVNNAAGNFIARTETLSPRAIDSVLNIVLHGTFYCSVAAGRRWIAEGKPGVILSIGSAAGDHGRAFTVPSAAAKAGVEAMMKSLAVEWGPHGIRTVTLSPGLFPTKGAWENLYPEGAKSYAQEMEIPLRRTGDHAEIANLVCYLLSDQAGYINGETVVMDGGRHLQNGGGAGVMDLMNWSEERWAQFKKTGR
ncbi:SDR family oxidoreductase [Oryzicola mucosus]|uniref:SDR family oxidoreductase n=1 Tax=Oryzicola mucosus TaxID=2767425 RepID=A0A8J6U600_9HYPH|nr:SDR family oxidoreductase [Oryzicola mucosus]MBD0417340.1 SDR family oxidoreductase [Oryzicola mucosus]